MRIGKLAAAWAASGLRMYELAAAAQVSPSALSNIIAGRHRANRSQQERLASALGVDVDVIFGGDDLVVHTDDGALIAS